MRRYKQPTSAGGAAVQALHEARVDVEERVNVVVAHVVDLVPG